MAARLVNRVARLRGQRLISTPRRTLCSSKSNPDVDITNVSLAEKLPGFPAPKYAVVTSESSDTQVTTLENGLRVASENKFGQFCTVGVLIDSGSRYESAYPSGITHFLEKMSFGKTSSWENRDQILQELEQVGGICDCQGSRDTLVYAASARTDGLSKVMNILSDVVLRPEFPQEQLEDAQQAIRFEIELMNMDPNPEQLLMEMIHAAAYRNNTLGLPRICPEENIDQITRDTLYRFMAERHAPHNMVVAGVGVDHQTLVEETQRLFVEKTPLWLAGDKSGAGGISSCVSQYTGGHVLVEKDLSNVSLGPTPMPELAHVVFGLESCGHKDPDFIAYCVLNMMLGGGGSFSAGGPGKGMYTRLYLNVLNRYTWIESATAYNHAYEDSGVFCIHASSHPSKLRELAEVIMREMVFTSSMVYQISKDELNRAKRQLQSMLMMNLEVRPVVFEDIGRQVLAGSARRTPQYYYDQIGKITERDIMRVAQRMLKSKLSVAAYGTLSQLPSYNDMETALMSKDGSMPRRKTFSLFRR